MASSGSLPPSYRDTLDAATDWMSLVAPHVPRRDHPALCAVSWRSWATFAPRIWRDPVRTARESGLDPADDLTWWRDFVLRRACRAGPRTRALVRVIDLRAFAADACGGFGSAEEAAAIASTFPLIPRLFPNLRCVLLDGRSAVDPATVLDPAWGGAAEEVRVGLGMVSIPDCRTAAPLPATFFATAAFRSVVYLDVSGLAGSLRPLIDRLGSGHLSHLRVLKARARSMDDRTAADLFAAVGTQLWSLDVGDNLLTDAALETLRARCFAGPSLRDDSRFPVEGRLVSCRPEDFGGVAGSREWGGAFLRVAESGWSCRFAHPERHCADPPAYDRRTDRRSDGRGARRRDGADQVMAELVGGSDELGAAAEMLALDVALARGRGITHLHLSGNGSITAQALQRVVRLSLGQLEHLECDSMEFQPAASWRRPGRARQWPPKPWPKSSRMHGLLGASHVFRPLISSNLESLRVHHSAVTQIPTLSVDGMSPLARLRLAETSVRERAEAAFPAGGLVPDANPRLRSLTLTRVPRRSSGPLIASLVRLLKLASEQERAIEDARERFPRAAFLRGLAHIRLEFEPDPVETGAEPVSDIGRGGFTFFPPEHSPRGSSLSEPGLDHRHASDSAVAAVAPRSGRIILPPPTEPFLSHACTTLDGVSTAVPVWTGSRSSSSSSLQPRAPSAAVQRYSELVRRDEDLRADVGPATPPQVLAGVPEDVLVFHAAWDAQVLDGIDPGPGLESGSWEGAAAEGGEEEQEQEQEMKDVLAEIKAWRRRAKATRDAMVQARGAGGRVPAGAPHYWWQGRLEVAVMQEGEAGFWR